jgi:ribosomal protein L29
MDNTTMLMWSESNRDVAEALRETQKELMELRFAVTSLKDKIK